MVKITAALVAALAGTAAASAHRNIGRRHMHPRNYPVNAPPAHEESSTPAAYPINTPPVATSSEVPSAYPTAPVHEESSTTTHEAPVYPTGPVPSDSETHVPEQPTYPVHSDTTTPVHEESSTTTHEVVYPTGPVPSESETHPVPSESETHVPVYPTHPVPSESSTSHEEVPPYPTHPVPDSSSSHAVYPTAPVPSDSETHVPVYPTHPVPSASSVETHPVPSASHAPEYPVHPVPSASSVETHPVPSASEHPAAPTYPVGEGSHAPAPSTPVGEHEEVCEPVVITVTAGQPEAPYPTHPVPSASSVETHPVPSASSVETHPVPSSSSAHEVYPTHPVPSSSSAVETYPVHTPPVASSSSASEEHPAPTYGASFQDTPASSSHPAPAGGKRGLIYQEQSNLEGFKNNGAISWAWNWNSNDFGMEAPWSYVPILNNRDQYSTFESQARSAIQALTGGSNGDAFVMGPNEPDQDAAGGGSAMPNVEDAVDAYSTYIAPFAGSARLGSISVTSDQTPGNNKGMEYLRSWKQACDARGDGACPVDFVCLHWYGPNGGESGADQAQLFIDYMDGAIAEVKEMFGQDMRVWVTEFGAQPPLNQDPEAAIHAPFMEQVLPYLDSNNDVERYSYFMASPEYMVNADGSLTPGGEAYCN